MTLSPLSPSNRTAPADPPQEQVALRSAERARDLAVASRDRFSFLAEVSRCLADSLDYEATLVTVAGMSLPYLDAWCIVDVLDERGEVRRIAVVHPDPAKQETARRLHTQYPPPRRRPDRRAAGDPHRAPGDGVRRARRGTGLPRA